MNREIKFRVWASNDAYPSGKMYMPEEDPDFVLNMHGDLIKSVSKGDFLSACTWARISFNGIRLMQFTGLHDKNGKEIYEGDKVRYSNQYEHGDGVIEFQAGFIVAWDLSTVKTEKPMIMSPLFYFQCSAEWEVIGNIHENPELLTSSD